MRIDAGINTLVDVEVGVEITICRSVQREIGVCFEIMCIYAKTINYIALPFISLRTILR
jgi:hypothetical protein